MFTDYEKEDLKTKRALIGVLRDIQHEMKRSNDMVDELNKLSEAEALPSIEFESAE